LKTVDGKAPPLTPAAQAVYAAHKAAIAKGDFSFDGATHCLPPGLRADGHARALRDPQRPKALYFVYQIIGCHDACTWIGSATDVDPHYLGYSVGKWDGDALVVDTAASMTAPCSTMRDCPTPMPCT